MTNQERTVAEIRARMFAATKTPQAYELAYDLAGYFIKKDIEPLVGVLAMLVTIATTIKVISSSKEITEELINATADAIRSVIAAEDDKK